MTEYPSTRIGYTFVRKGAQAPERKTAGASGFDLRARIDAPIVLEPGGIGLVPTGVALAIPDGFEGQVRARSGLALRNGIVVVNGPGTIDADYRGEIGIILGNLGREPFRVEDGDRIAQIVFARVPRVEMEERESLTSTERGGGGFGHTGRQ